MKRLFIATMLFLLMASYAHAKVTNLRITWEDEGVGATGYVITYEQGSNNGVVATIDNPVLREITVNNIDMPVGMVTFYIQALYPENMNVTSDPYKTILGKPRILGIVTF